MRICAHGWKLAEEWHDFTGAGGATCICDVTALCRVNHVAAAPEIMKRIVHSDDADAVFIGHFHAGIHRRERDRLAEFLVGVPALDGFEFGWQLLQLRARRAAADLRTEQLVEVDCLDGVVRANAVRCS